MSRIADLSVLVYKIELLLIRTNVMLTSTYAITDGY